MGMVPKQNNVFGNDHKKHIWPWHRNSLGLSLVQTLNPNTSQSVYGLDINRDNAQIFFFYL